MDKFKDRDQKLVAPAMMTTSKGELVEELADRHLTASEEMLRENPYKTSPNKLTSKNRNTEEKG